MESFGIILSSAELSPCACSLSHMLENQPGVYVQIYVTTQQKNTNRSNFVPIVFVRADENQTCSPDIENLCIKNFLLLQYLSSVSSFFLICPPFLCIFIFSPSYSQQSLKFPLSMLKRQRLVFSGLVFNSAVNLKFFLKVKFRRHSFQCHCLLRTMRCVYLLIGSLGVPEGSFYTNDQQRGVELCQIFHYTEPPDLSDGSLSRNQSCHADKSLFHIITVFYTTIHIAPGDLVAFTQHFVGEKTQYFPPSFFFLNSAVILHAENSPSRTIPSPPYTLRCDHCVFSLLHSPLPSIVVVSLASAPSGILLHHNLLQNIWEHRYMSGRGLLTADAAINPPQIWAICLQLATFL